MVWSWTEHENIDDGGIIAALRLLLSAFDEGDHIAIPNPGYLYRNLMMALGLERYCIAGAEWLMMLSDMEKWEKLPDGPVVPSSQPYWCGAQ